MTFATMTNRATGYVVLETDWDNITNNFDHLNTSQNINLFPASSGIAPTSGLAAGALSQVQSSGAGTIKPEWWILSLDASTDEGRIWQGRVPRGYGSTLTVSGQFYMASATSGNVVLSAQIACITDADASGTAKVFATENSSTVAVPGAAGTAKAFSITMTNADSITAGDRFMLAFRRDADNGSDTATGDLQLTLLDLYFSLA